jgi:IS5 family transposase
MSHEEAAEKVWLLVACLPAARSICWDDRGMQGFERADRGLWDVQALVGHLLPEDGMFAFLAAHRGEVFPDAEWADLFADFGRPSEPVTRMAAIMTLQAIHGFSDRETADAVRFDLRWKMACGLALEDGGIHPTTLVTWRGRVARSARPYRLNEAVRRVVAATGILAGRRRRVADSTILADAVATQDTVTQLIAAMRRVLRQVPGAAGVIARECAGFDYAAGRRPVIDWSDPQAARELVSALVNDADAVVAALREARLEDGPAAALALLAATAGQDVEPAEGSDGTDGRWQIAGKVAEDRIISQVDPESRHARKNWHTPVDGYRAHVCAEPATGIITDEDLTMACGEGCSDAETAARFLAAERGQDERGQDGRGQDPGAGDGAGAGGGQVPGADGGSGGPGQQQGRHLAWYADSAYGTGELRAVIAAAGDTAVIKPKTMRPPAVPGGFTSDDFTIDHQARTATCPARITRPITPSGRVYFGAACRTCPLRARCTPAKTGRTLALTPHDQLLRQARRDWAEDKALRKDYRATRPHVERTVAQVATSRGRRLKLRYRGTAKNKAWLKTRTAAVNLTTLLRHGLSRDGGTWTATCATG